MFSFFDNYFFPPIFLASRWLETCVVVCVQSFLVSSPVTSFVKSPTDVFGEEFLEILML